tara:strand:+ start:1457 stop:3880 length:2424 start_codon:yes stop_codon:yes gene_type:complete
MTTAKKKEKKKLLNRPHALPQNFLTFKVAYGDDDDLKRSQLGMGSTSNEGQTYRLKGTYRANAVVSRFFGSLDGRTVNEKFLNLENHKISSLVPELILYKVFETDGKVSELRPFYFPVAADYVFDGDKVNLSKPFSGNGATIDSFQLSYTSQEVYDTSRKFVEANLSITVDHMATLFEKEGSADYAPLVDLFTISAGNRMQSGRLKKSKSKGKTLTPNALDNGFSSRIAATLGYNVPDNGIFDSTEKQVIESTKSFINLNYFGHSVTFEQNGAVKINVKYTGFLTAIKGESMYSLIAGTRGKTASAKLKAPADQLGEDINKSFGEKSRIKEEDNEESTEEEEDNLTIDDIQLQFKRVMDLLYNSGKIHSTPFEAKEFFNASGHLAKSRAKKEKETGQSAPPPGRLENFQTNLANASSDSMDVFTKVFSTKETINYVNFGDFLEAYITTIHTILRESVEEIDKQAANPDDEVPETGPKKMKKERATELKNYIRSLKNKLFDAKILLANFETETIEVGSSEPKSVFTNIADVPVSLDTIYTYVYRNLSLLRKFFFDINEFLTKMCLQILSQSLVERPNCEMLKDVSFMVSKMTARDFKNKARKGNLKVGDIPAPVGNYSKNSGKQMMEYIIFHQAPQAGVVPGFGSLSEDSKNGIFHLRLGQTHGLLKSVNFSKQSDPGREAYLVIKNGRGYDELRLPHDATAEMVGNNLFLPMSFVYLNPDTVGFGDLRLEESSARRLGLGGYYIVGGVTTTYSGGDMTTSLQLRFNGFPDNDGKTTFETAQKDSINDLNKSMTTLLKTEEERKEEDT